MYALLIVCVLERKMSLVYVWVIVMVYVLGENESLDACVGDCDGVCMGYGWGRVPLCVGYFHKRPLHAWRCCMKYRAAK